MQCHATSLCFKLEKDSQCPYRPPPVAAAPDSSCIPSLLSFWLTSYLHLPFRRTKCMFAQSRQAEKASNTHFSPTSAQSHCSWFAYLSWPHPIPNPFLPAHLFVIFTYFLGGRQKQNESSRPLKPCRLCLSLNRLGSSAWSLPCSLSRLNPSSSTLATVLFTA